MVKGVRQCVVEISITENDYFEKAILFVNPERIAEGKHSLQREGRHYLQTIGENAHAGGARRWKWILYSAVNIALGAFLGIAAAWFLG